MNADHNALVKRLTGAKGVLTGITKGIAISISGEEKEGLESMLIGFYGKILPPVKPFTLLKISHSH